MKKKIIMLLLCVAVGAFAAGCSDKDTKDASNSGSSSNSASTSSSEDNSAVNETIPITDEEVPVSECITLGEYKGITLDKKIRQVTDEDVEDSISNALMAAVTDPEAAVENGDTVDIAYEGKIDGVAFDGGSTDSDTLVVGAGGYIDGFEEGLVGMKQDETKDLNLKFPDDYKSTDLAGKDVVFTVTINAIMRPQELTEEWVQENTDYSSIDEYRQAQRDQMEASNELAAENNLDSEALQAVLDNADIKMIPQTYITLGENMYDQIYTSYASLYGVTLEEFIEQYLGQETYDSDKGNYARQVAELALVINAVSEQEGWTSEDEDYVTRFNNRVENSGLSEDEYVEQNGQENIDLSINQDRVIDLVLNNATINDVTVDASGNPV